MRKVTANLGETAHVLGLTPKALREAIERGCPVESRPGKGGREAVFDLRKVFAWRLTELTAGKPETPVSTARERLLSAQAARAERANQLADGDLASISVVAAFFGELAGMMRTRMLGISTTIAPELIGLTDVHTAGTIVDREIRAGLTSIADFNARNLPVMKRLRSR